MNRSTHKDAGTALLIHVRGLVQGVGFRPFIYRLAQQHVISGWVENRNDGVRIHAEGGSVELQQFLEAIEGQAPAASVIRSVDSTPAPPGNYSRFIIKKSEDTSEEVTDISPDIAVCEECLEDMKQQKHRLDYPFINCTNCGPRFTIISDLPYDREKTTMKVFPMCETCASEYKDILDRRFHAQPVACNVCGPHYEMHTKSGPVHGTQRILDAASREIMEGRIVAIKGQGGFHLACDAFNESAVSRLRRQKNREGKPFAVMFADIQSARECLLLDEHESRALLLWQRPIVILENKPGAGCLAFSVSNGFHTTGAMLPYMPFHYLLFSKLGTKAIVLTSGNISDEPILIDNAQAMTGLKNVADSFIVYNRDILNRTDDSVAMVVSGTPRLLRRSRGFVPAPVQTDLDTEGIFAAGAELVNCFCIGKGKQAFLSQHIGDLKNLETLEFYEESYRRFQTMYRFEPVVCAVDLHPDYLSRKFCMEQLQRSQGTAGGIPVEVQHHHAHIASCMAEHGLDEMVIGVSLDGVGYGTDGHIWGFEFMTCDLSGFQRIAHPEYLPQPGGDLTTREPWRMAVSYLYKVYGSDFMDLPLPFLRQIEKEKLELVTEAIRKDINAPLTCSAGRLFDATAVLAGACLESSFHAEAPMRLEQIIRHGEQGAYEFETGPVINTASIIRDVTEDMIRRTDPGVISARFHNTIVNLITEVSQGIREETGLRKVVLSGGTFQNRYLLEKTEAALSGSGFKVFSHQQVPANDGGIALGQLVIAAKRRSLSRH